MFTRALTGIVWTMSATHFDMKYDFTHTAFVLEETLLDKTAGGLLTQTWITLISLL